MSIFRTRRRGDAGKNSKLFGADVFLDGLEGHVDEVFLPFLIPHPLQFARAGGGEGGVREVFEGNGGAVFVLAGAFFVTVADAVAGDGEQLGIEAAALAFVFEFLDFPGHDGDGLDDEVLLLGFIESGAFGEMEDDGPVGVEKFLPRGAVAEVFQAAEQAGAGDSEGIFAAGGLAHLPSHICRGGANLSKEFARAHLAGAPMQ